MRPLPVWGAGAATGLWWRSRSWFDSTHGAYQARAQPLARRWTLRFRGPVDRASASGAEGRGFESRRKHERIRHLPGVQWAGIGVHDTGFPRHPPCRGRPSRAWWRTGGQCPSPPAPADGVQRVGGRANRHIGGWCNWQHNGLWNRMLQVRILPRLRTIHGGGHGPANSLSWRGRGTGPGGRRSVDGFPAGASPIRSRRLRPGIGGRVDHRPSGA